MRAAGSMRGAWARLRRIRWRRLWLALAYVIVALVLGGWVAAQLVPLPERLRYGDSVVATYRDGSAAHALLSEDDKWRFPTRKGDVDPAYIEALIAFEDRRFRRHLGVDPIAIVRAAAGNLRAGSLESGASTITMQLVRLLEPRPRTFRSKIVESLRALQLEVRMSKDDILEAYMRFAPYGGNVEGIEAATQSYWGRSPASLSAPEIATLLAVPQSPRARRPSAENRDALRRARDRIALRLAENGAIPMSGRPEALAEALAETEVPTGADKLPRDIPHVVQWLEAHRPDAFARDETGRGRPAVRIETTLDRRAQRRIAEIVRDFAPRLRASGAPHAAVVVLEAETGRVRAIVGNLGFDPSRPGTSLPAFDAPRSTGSLLKPVAYAAALDEGLIAPSHALLDVPITRGDYRPENFDRTYRGLVEAEEALALSLNLPFVRLVESLGVDEFVQAVVRFELEGPARRAGHGGLELVIGGMPASPLEVASLYAGLARGGRPVAPRIYDLEGDDEAPDAGDARAVSAAAAYLTARALTRRAHPWADVGPRRAKDEAFVWKTGTSYAYHDAWTAGFGAEYVVTVWAGDLAYERHPELVGARVAAPLFFEILDALDEPLRLRATRPSDELAEIEVCTRSGRRPGPHCHHTSTVQMPARTAAPATCTLHDEIDVDAETGRRLPSGCRPDSVEKVERRRVVRFPDAMARFERARGRRGGTLPAIHPECVADREASLSITSPPEEATIVLERARPATLQTVRFEAYSSIGSDVHWYIDGRHHATTPPDEAVTWIPEPGDYRIAAVDRRGNRDVRALSVKGNAAPPTREHDER